MKNIKLRKAVILLSIFFSFCSRISFADTHEKLAYKINSNCFKSDSNIKLKIIDFEKSSISEKNILNLIFSDKEINLNDISIEIGKCIKIGLNSNQDRNYNYNLFIYIKKT